MWQSSEGRTCKKGCGGKCQYFSSTFEWACGWSGFETTPGYMSRLIYLIDTHEKNVCYIWVRWHNALWDFSRQFSLNRTLHLADNPFMRIGTLKCDHSMINCKKHFDSWLLFWFALELKDLPEFKDLSKFKKFFVQRLYEILHLSCAMKLMSFAMFCI